MAVANEREKGSRSTASGRSSNRGQRSSATTRRRNGAAPRGRVQGAKRSGAANRSGASTRKRPSATASRRSASRATPRSGAARRNGALKAAGVSALSATIGVAGGVLLGRTALQRNRKLLGLPVPSKIELGDVGEQIAEAGRQFGKLAGEVRAVRRKAQQIGRVLS